ncbi:MAG TPA: CidA/LrgA family protein, partial [Vicinamibacteria bacterium]|nr:CidA/LrgA family protein [Vicinamibacteria bacterium]
ALLVQTLRLPIPANLAGVLLLLLLLRSGLVRPQHLREVTALVNRHLALLFVPFLVGGMAWSGLSIAGALVLGAVLLGSTTVGLATTGLAAQWVRRSLP